MTYDTGNYDGGLGNRNKRHIDYGDRGTLI